MAQPSVPFVPDVIRIAHPDETDPIAGLIAAALAPLPLHAYGTGRLRAAGRWAYRVRDLGYALVRRPGRGSHHLMFLAVHPRDQWQGLGSALLAHYHSKLDRHDEPVSVDVPDRSLQDYFRRHGHTTTGSALRLYDAPPSTWPMRRPPRAGPPVSPIPHAVSDGYPTHSHPSTSRGPTNGQRNPHHQHFC